VKLFHYLYKFGIESAEEGILKMLTLLFSKDLAVSSAVFDCYK